MYLALVRPHTGSSVYLEIHRSHIYASQVWDPHLQKDINQLKLTCTEVKFALRMCAKQWDLGYTS